LNGSRFWPKWLLVWAFAMLGFVVMGYHPGLEDDGVYLAAVKADVQPALYPHDAAFFRLQLKATVFDRWMAEFVDITRTPVPWAELIWQLLTLYLTLWAAHSIAAHLFAERRAQWAGVAMLAAMFTLPVAGTALYIADQHLHPRNVATALILLAVSRILAKRTWQAAAFLVLAVLMHPIMGALGVSFCCFLAASGSEWVSTWFRGAGVAGQVAGAFGWLRAPAGAKEAAEKGRNLDEMPAMRTSGAEAHARWARVMPGTNPRPSAVVPSVWVFEAPSAEWRAALLTRSYYFLYHWAWYEWVGAIAPMVLFGMLAAWARWRGETMAARFALAVFAYGVFQQAAAMVVLGFPALVRLVPLQPMRYLHLVYVFTALVGGCLLGRHVLKASAWRWAVLLIAVNAGMFVVQRAEFGHSPHLELPGRDSGNAWLQAFAWVRQNTPKSAYFALDPHYMEAPGEDFHSFRALAERSQLADAVKDTAVVTQVPQLGPEWSRQVQAQTGWKQFKLQDFERLKTQFGADWALVSYPASKGLECPWHNDVLVVCHIP
jgi:hypothetical protein